MQKNFSAFFFCINISTYIFAPKLNSNEKDLNSYLNSTFPITIKNNLYATNLLSDSTFHNLYYRGM